MKKEFMKMAGVKNEKDFYAKYPSESHFLEAFPQAVKMVESFKHGGQLSGAPYNGQPTAAEFFSYGRPTPNFPRLFQDGGDMPDEPTGKYSKEELANMSPELLNIIKQWTPGFRWSSANRDDFMSPEMMMQYPQGYVPKVKRIQTPTPEGDAYAIDPGMMAYGGNIPYYQDGSETDEEPGYYVTPRNVGIVGAAATVPYWGKPAVKAVGRIPNLVPTYNSLSDLAPVTPQRQKDIIFNYTNLPPEKKARFDKLGKIKGIPQAEKLQAIEAGDDAVNALIKYYKEAPKVDGKVLSTAEFTAMKKGEKILATYPLLKGLKGRNKLIASIALGLGTMGALAIYDKFFNEAEPVYNEDAIQDAEFMPDEVSGAYTPVPQYTPRTPIKKQIGGSAPMNSNEDSIINGKREALLRFMKDNQMKQMNPVDPMMNQGGGYYNYGGQKKRLPSYQNYGQVTASATPVSGLTPAAGVQSYGTNWGQNNFGTTPPPAPTNPYEEENTTMDPNQTDDQNLIGDNQCPFGMQWNEQTQRCEKRSGRWQDYIPNTEAIVGSGISFMNRIAERMERKDHKGDKNRLLNMMDPTRYATAGGRLGKWGTNNEIFDPSAMTAGTMSPGPQYVPSGAYGGEMYLDDNEIEYIKRNGGSVEYLD